MVTKILHVLVRIYFMLRETSESILTWLTTEIDWPDWLEALEVWFPTETPLEMMFGAGLVGLLIFIIVKFYADVVL